MNNENEIMEFEDITWTDLLGLIAEESFNDPENAFRLLKEYNKKFHYVNDNIYFISQAVSQFVYRRYSDVICICEKDLYPMFDSCISKINDENITIIEKKMFKEHRPDRWLAIVNEEIPVEFKLHKFNSSALKQLKRYIQNYNCKFGVAIGENLTVSLPDNIVFISVNDIRNHNLKAIENELNSLMH